MRHFPPQRTPTSLLCVNKLEPGPITRPHASLYASCTHSVLTKPANLQFRWPDYGITRYPLPSTWYYFKVVALDQLETRHILETRKTAPVRRIHSETLSDIKARLCPLAVFQSLLPFLTLFSACNAYTDREGRPRITPDNLVLRNNTKTFKFHPLRIQQRPIIINFVVRPLGDSNPQPIDSNKGSWESSVASWTFLTILSGRLVCTCNQGSISAEAKHSLHSLILPYLELQPWASLINPASTHLLTVLNHCYRNRDTLSGGNPHPHPHPRHPRRPKPPHP